MTLHSVGQGAKWAPPEVFHQEILADQPGKEEGKKGNGEEKKENSKREG